MTEGFFTEAETAAKPPIRPAGCGACRLHKECRSPRMSAQGKGGRGILIVTDAPSAADDRQGSLFCGDAGIFLQKKMKLLGVDLDRDCVVVPAISCHPGDRAPSSDEVGYCRSRVWKEIEEFRPELIILLGNSAVQAFLGDRWQKGLGGQETTVIEKWRGWAIPDREVQAWVCPIFHPQFVLEEQEKNPAAAVIFQNDLATALKMLDTPFPGGEREEDCVTIIEDPAKLHSKLQGLLEWPDIIAFDYETTGLKPHAPGHKIFTCAIATGEWNAFAFVVPEGGKLRSLLRKIMMDPSIPKIAHNIKYEDNWSHELLGPVDGWVWDTMLASHVLDNRPGITGLKFQAYVNFGVLDYSSHIEPFLQAPGSNDLNRVEEAPRRDLLIYNGVDAMLTYRLAMKQTAAMGFSIADFLVPF